MFGKKGSQPEVPDTIECPPHNWEPTYDAEGEIIGRICLTCGKVEGRMS